MTPLLPRLWIAAVLALMVIAPWGAARAQQPSFPGPRIPPSLDKVTIKVYNATFNQLADKVAPLHLNGHYTFNVTACLPGTSVCNTTPICSSDWTVTITQLRFAITPAGIQVTGNGNAAWCGVGTGFSLETSASVSHVETLRIVHAPIPAVPRTDEIVVTVKPTSVQPVLKLGGNSVALPIHINVASALSFPMPLGASLMSFETPTGPRQLRLSPTQISLIMRNGYIEIQSGVSIW
jgi:hypothetical protein